jgi:hypothetical protein
LGNPTERKERSERLLKNFGININPNLPLVENENEDEIKLRTKEEIVDRIIALTLVSAKAMGATKEEVDGFIETYNAPELFSQDEKEFISNKNPNQNNFVAFSWKIECVWVLLWSLKLIPDLKYPNNTCDVDLIYKTVFNKSKEELLNDSSPRTDSEILDNLDLIYRIHWAVRDAQANDRDMPKELNESVVYERHYGFNWLVNYMEQEWDEVSTDT